MALAESVHASCPAGTQNVQIWSDIWTIGRVRPAEHIGGSVRAGEDLDWSWEATRLGSSSKVNQRELPLPTAVD